MLGAKYCLFCTSTQKEKRKIVDIFFFFVMNLVYLFCFVLFFSLNVLLAFFFKLKTKSQRLALITTFLRINPGHDTTNLFNTGTKKKEVCYLLRSPDPGETKKMDVIWCSCHFWYVSAEMPWSDYWYCCCARVCGLSWVCQTSSLSYTPTKQSICFWSTGESPHSYALDGLLLYCALNAVERNNPPPPPGTHYTWKPRKRIPSGACWCNGRRVMYFRRDA